MRAIKRRIRALCLEIAEVLRTTRRQHSGEEVRCAVVDRVTPGPAHLELQAFAQATSNLRLQTVVAGVPEGYEANDVAQRESRLSVHGIESHTSKGSSKAVTDTGERVCE